MNLYLSSRFSDSPVISVSLDSGLIEFNLYQEMYQVVQLALQESTQFLGSKQERSPSSIGGTVIHDCIDVGSVEGPYQQQTSDDLRNGSFEYILVEGTP